MQNCLIRNKAASALPLSLSVKFKIALNYMKVALLHSPVAGCIDLIKNLRCLLIAPFSHAYPVVGIAFSITVNFSQTENFMVGCCVCCN